MNNTEKVIAAIVAAFLLLGGYMFHRSEVDAATERATLQATLKQQGDVIQGLQQQIKSRDAVAVKQDSAVDQSVAQAKTQAQIAALIGQLAGLKGQPIQIQLPPAKDGKPLPDAPSYTLTLDQGKQLLDFEASCKKCQNDLTAAQGARGDQEKQIAALTQERDAAVKFSKGGSGWSRFKKAAKWLAVGAAIGYAAHR